MASFVAPENGHGDQGRTAEMTPDEKRMYAQRQVDESLMRQLETFAVVAPHAEPDWALVASVNAEACAQVRLPRTMLACFASEPPAVSGPGP